VADLTTIKGLGSVKDGSARCADSTDRRTGSVFQEKSREQKHAALFWLNELVLSVFTEDVTRHESPASFAYWIATGVRPGIAKDRPLDVPSFFKGMSHQKVAAHVSHTMNFLVQKGTLYREPRNEFRKTTILEKLAKLG
jgi:hypothetical protein